MSSPRVVRTSGFGGPGAVTRSGEIEQLLPLGRLVVGGVAFAAMAVAWVLLRVDVSHLKEEVRYNQEAWARASEQHDLLELELAARRRVLALEAAGEALSLSSAARTWVAPATGDGGTP